MMSNTVERILMFTQLGTHSTRIPFLTIISVPIYYGITHSGFMASIPCALNTLSNLHVCHTFLVTVI